MSAAPLVNVLAKLSSLQQRVVTAVVLAPIVTFIFYLGGAVFVALLMVALMCAYQEWIRISYRTTAPIWPKKLEYTAMATLALTICMAYSVTYALAFALCGIGTVITAIIAHLYLERGPRSAATLSTIGVVYLGIAGLSLVWLREQGAIVTPQHEWALLLVIILHVWATDTFAYIFGRLIGGPKLMPRVSPKKTWAGLIGGSISASIVMGWLAGWALLPHANWFYFLGVVLAVMAQIGDLIESHLKRLAGFKDSGTILPGHGGILDRIDGLIMAAPIYAVVIYVLI